MEVSLALRRAYFKKLNGNITLDGDTIPVFDAYALPEDVTYPYMLLSSQVNVQRGVKCNTKMYNSTILVDIVTGDIDPIGREQSEVIANKIETLVYPDNDTDLDLTDDGWEIGHTQREQDFDSSQRSDVYYIFRKLIRYEHLISKTK